MSEDDGAGLEECGGGRKPTPHCHVCHIVCGWPMLSPGKMKALSLSLYGNKNMETIYWTCGGVANMVNSIIVRLNNAKLSSFKPGYRSKWQIYRNFEKTYIMTEVPQ